MEREVRVTIVLTGRDVRAAQVNSGLTVDLPPGTLQVVIKVNPNAEARAE